MLNVFNHIDFIIFTSRDYANHQKLSMSAASKRLSRLKENNALVQITKGLWANTSHPYFHPASCVPYLLNKESGYVSFLTALHYHGLISQIPKTIQVATTGHSRSLDSPVAYYEFIQIKPELMREHLTWSETQLPYMLATPEKALVDVLYISTRKNRRFVRLPELTLTADLFDKHKFVKIINQLPLSMRLSNAMTKRAEDIGIL